MSSDECSPSWGELVTRLWPFVRRQVSTDADAEDVMQEVLLRMHRGLPTLRDETRLSAWMYRIARSSIVDHYRSHRRQPLSLDADLECSEDSTLAASVAEFEAPEDSMIQELANSLRPMVDALPPVYREAVQLVEIEGHRQHQAAERLGLSVSGMKSRVQRGRAKLKTMLEDCCSIALDARGKVMSCEPRPESRTASGPEACLCCDEISDSKSSTTVS